MKSARADIPILYVDNHLLVVEKPAGMLSQADHTGDEDLLSLMKTWVGERFNKPGNVYLGLVHRIDRPASGLMVFARTSKAASRLSEQFRKRSVEKRYVAWVEGQTPVRASWDDFLVKEDQRVSVVPSDHHGAKHASLDMETILCREGRSLVAVRLHTGRPHQIRVQFASRGFPLVGDLRYGAGSELDGRNLALHAAALALDHPTRKTRMGWTALPPASWPVEMRRATRGWLGEWESDRNHVPDLPPLSSDGA